MNIFYLLLFFLLYLEYSLFGENYLPYLLINFLFHSLNCFLLYRIFSELFSTLKNSHTLALVLSIAYLVSGLHAEALQWAFEQTLLICSSLMFFSLYQFQLYIKEENNIPLVKAFIAATLSPLFFGNGFIVILFAGCLGVFYFLIGKKTKPYCKAIFYNRLFFVHSSLPLPSIL